MPRYIKDLLIEATKRSLKRGLDFIDEESLHDAFHRLTRSTQRYAVNPFGDTKFDYFKAMEVKIKQEKAFIDSKKQEKRKGTKSTKKKLY
ncbi:hypothetical protein D3C75_1235230 [compost metagenome]